MFTRAAIPMAENLASSFRLQEPPQRQTRRLLVCVRINTINLSIWPSAFSPAPYTIFENIRSDSLKKKYTARRSQHAMKAPPQAPNIPSKSNETFRTRIAESIQKSIKAENKRRRAASISARLIGARRAGAHQLKTLAAIIIEIEESGAF